MKRQPKIGEKVWVKKVSSEKVCTVKSINWIYVTVRPLCARQDVEVTIDDIEYIAEEILDGKEKSEIIKRLVKNETLIGDKTNYYREVATLNNLIKKYPDLDFWREFDPGFQAKSLMWYFGGGKLKINDSFNNFNLDFSPKKSTIGEVKLGEDVKVEKQQTLRDILS